MKSEEVKVKVDQIEKRNKNICIQYILTSGFNFSLSQLSWHLKSSVKIILQTLNRFSSASSNFIWGNKSRYLHADLSGIRIFFPHNFLSHPFFSLPPFPPGKKSLCQHPPLQPASYATWQVPSVQQCPFFQGVRKHPEIGHKQSCHSLIDNLPGGQETYLEPIMQELNPRQIPIARGQRRVYNLSRITPRLTVSRRRTICIVISPQEFENKHIRGSPIIQVPVPVTGIFPISQTDSLRLSELPSVAESTSSRQCQWLSVDSNRTRAFESTGKNYCHI